MDAGMLNRKVGRTFLITLTMLSNRLMGKWRMGALLPIAVVAVTNVIHSAKTVPPAPFALGPMGLDNVMKREQQFADLKVSLQRRGVPGVLGYIGETSGDSSSENPRLTEDYYLAQFVLVPWVLDRHAAASDWSVANLRSSAARTYLPSNLQVVEDFGNGVLLLKRSTP